MITGASDDDPSGIVTYSQAGAAFGFSMLWTALLTLPLMIAVQEMCARIGTVTGRGIVANLKRRAPRWLVLLVVGLVTVANTINIGADLGMMASAMQLLVPVSKTLLLIGMGVVTLLLEIFLPYKTYARYLKWLTLTLLSYVLIAFVVRVPWREAIWSTFLPTIHFTKEYLLIFVAFLGTTISPYLFFWQASEEVEERSCVTNGTIKSMPDCLQKMRVDTALGMTYSNLIAWFIVLTAATVLFRHGVTDIQSADQAAAILEPLAGRFASSLFAFGVVGIGLLAIPVLSGSIAYAICEAFGWKEGLNKKWHQAKIFYSIIVASVVIGLAMNGLGINPVKQMIYAAVCNAIAAAPLLYVIQRLASDKKIMGKYVSSRFSRILCVMACVLMGAASLAWLVVEIV